MGIIRKNHSFGASVAPMKIDTEFVTTSDGLLRFASANGIELCPLDVKTLAEKAGIEVDYEPLNEDISGSLRRINGKWRITVNKHHHPRRQRYTIAHELGHYILHRHQEDVFEDHVFFRGVGRSTQEWEANTFASEILMPEDEFKRLVRDGIDDIDKLAKKFGVSTLALRIRAKELGFQGHDLD
jgi:Zn-dependent peptidase ImmA (M78 family)